MNEDGVVFFHVAQTFPDQRHVERLPRLKTSCRKADFGQQHLVIEVGDSL
jgi:hypothetical protein